MKKKPVVCVIDEDPQVRKGWRHSIGSCALIHSYKDHLEVFQASSQDKELIANFSCIIVGRYFKHLNLDIVKSGVPGSLKECGGEPIFLNWQGYITKDELSQNFDGKMFHRYGVRWQTLRLRIQKHQNTLAVNQAHKINNATPVTKDTYLDRFQKMNRQGKCQHLLELMAQKAVGAHRVRIEQLLNDPHNGLLLLEAMYNRLTVTKESNPTCPSRYINSSPVVAKRILQEALFS